MLGVLSQIEDFEVSLEPSLQWTKIITKTKPNQAKAKNIAKIMVLAIFWPTVTCSVPKSMCLSWEIPWQPQMRHWNQSKTNQPKPNPKI